MSDKYFVKKLPLKTWTVIERATAKQVGKFQRPTDTAAEQAARAMADRLNAESKAESKR